MKIHHLNCGTLCPRVPKKLIGHSCIVCHCLLIETGQGLVLVDTGLGVLDLEHPTERLGHIFTKFVKPKLDRDETALRHIERLGFRREDVRHIVLTHLDVDHAGGIADFPDAEIHVFEGELEAAMNKRSKLEDLRYHSVQWAHGPKWKRHSLEGDQWLGLQSVRALSDDLPEILLVPLLGHSRGHCGVAIRTDKDWLLHAGDAYFFHAEMNETHPHCSFGLNAFQKFMQVDGKLRLENQGRLRSLKKDQGSQLRMFCAHDLSELERFRNVQVAAH